MPKKDRLILYTDRGCPACKSFTPVFNKLVRQNHVPVERIDVHKCPSDDLVCKTLQFVPTVMYNGSEIPLERVGDKIKELSRKK